MKRFEFWLSLGCSLAASVASAATATTAEFRLSLKEDAIRTSAGEETLRYSSLWDGGTNETAKVTIAQNGTTLVENLTGEGERAWSVTHSGTYELSHTTYTNGVAGTVARATFVVHGPTLSLEADGELTNGVMIVVCGIESGWHAYYTLDGTTPTQSSASYTGPFSLPESGTVRVVAYSDAGIESDAIAQTFTLHKPLAIHGACARQRYPWNGMVDFDCTIVGDPDVAYRVWLRVADVAGGTNLPVKTAWVEGDGVTNDVFSLKPGTYRFTWNADADIPHDVKMPSLAASLRAAEQ